MRLASPRKPILLALAFLITAVALASIIFILNNSTSPARTNQTIASAPTSTLVPTLTSINATSTPKGAIVATALDNPGFEDGFTGWLLGYDGSGRSGVYPTQDYSVDIDHALFHRGVASAHIQVATSPPKSYGYIWTAISAANFKGKRVRYSAYLRTVSAAGTGLFMDVSGLIDGKPTDPDIPMSRDNMIPRREILGTTDWREYDIVLDVPPEAHIINLGLQVDYGQTWIDDVQLRVVGTDVPTTGPSARRQLDNLDFEQGLSPWETHTVGIGQTDIGTSSEMAHSGKQAAYIKHSGGDPDPNADHAPVLLYPAVYGQYYRDKTTRVTAYMNVDKAPRGAELYLWAYYLDNRGNDAGPLTDTVQVLPAKSGAIGWQKVQTTIDVPDRTQFILFGAGLHGDGELWIDDVHLDILGPSPTATPIPKPGTANLPLPQMADFAATLPKPVPLRPTNGNK